MQNYGGTITWKPFCKEHAWGEWTVITEPTCTEKGEETRTCTETESVPPVESGEPDDPEKPSAPVTPVKPLWRSWLEKILERLPRWWK